MDFELEDKVALVTGGSRGIGRATALMLARHGATVAICGRTLESLDETASAIRAIGRQCWKYQTDVSQSAQIEQLIASVGEDAKRHLRGNLFERSHLKVRCSTARQASEAPPSVNRQESANQIGVENCPPRSCALRCAAAATATKRLSVSGVTIACRLTDILIRCA